LFADAIASKGPLPVALELITALADKNQLGVGQFARA
jgi:hypothetical protein